MMLKSTISAVYDDQKNLLQNLPIGLSREILSSIEIESPYVIIISGIRRCGKSTLLRQIINKKIPVFHFFNFEDHRNISFEVTDFEKLKNIFLEKSQGDVFLFDEIQNINDWERFVRTEQDLGQKIIITGSNASLLSAELGNKLTGRHITYELFPFSYTEFLQFTNQTANESSLGEYMQKGGFPGYLTYPNENILQQVFSDIVIRDIVSRYGLKNQKTIKEIGIYLLSNTGKEFSYSKLSKNFNIGSTNSIIQYISYFENSYLLFTIPKFSYSLKKQAVNPKKVYSIDTGLSSANSISFSKDFGRILENVVFLSIRRKYKQIFYFREKYECDFVIKSKNKIIQAIQVCYKLTEDNSARELNGIKEAMDFFKLDIGYIVTFNQDDEFKYNDKSIKVIPAWRWL